MKHETGRVLANGFNRKTLGSPGEKSFVQGRHFARDRNWRGKIWNMTRKSFVALSQGRRQIETKALEF